MFSRAEFQRLNRKYGPFTLDGAAHINGYNAQVNKFCSKTQDFFKTKLAGHTLWLNPPFDDIHNFLRHYLKEKNDNPTTTSAMIVLPRWTSAPWWHLTKGMQQVAEYKRGEHLFTAPGITPQDPRHDLGPTQWPVIVFWDPPRPTKKIETTVIEANHSVVSTTAESTPPDAPLLIFEAKCQGETVKVLIDSGAEINVLTQSLVTRKGFSTKPLAKPQPVCLAFGKEQAPTRGATLKLLMGPLRFVEEFTVLDLNIANVDIVLGTPWLKRHNPHIDWNSKTLEINGTQLIAQDHVPPKNPEVLMITHQQAKKALKHKEEAYLLLVRGNKDNVDTPSDLNHDDETQGRLDSKNMVNKAVQGHLKGLLDTYKDVFATLPPGLPPVRDIDHKIDLQPGSLPPSKPSYRMTPAELAEVQKQLADYLAKGYIEPSNSPYGAPVLLV